MFSVLILTKNEQSVLSGCLDSLSGCDDVVVYDSYSIDATRNIAQSSGARFVQRPHQDLSISFGGDESFHRNWGLSNIVFSYPWVFVIDADERLSAEALCSIRQVLSMSPSQQLPSQTPVAYQLRRRDFFQGRHLKHVQATPFYIRLFRPEHVHYERLINPVLVVNGPVASLDGYIDHYPFSNGLSHWISRHNTYSTLEAKQLASSLPHFPLTHLYGALFHPYFHIRRAHQKSLYMLLPARPLLKFVWVYFLKFGFLDGAPGFNYAILQSFYEYLITLKQSELRRAAQPLSPSRTIETV